MSNVEEMSEKAIIAEMIKAKDRVNAANGKYRKMSTELERRAIKEIEEHNVKCVRFGGTNGSVSVCNKSSLSLISPFAFKRFIGADSFNAEVKEITDVTYKPSSGFEVALKAIFLRDYDFDMTLDEVFDSLGADYEQRSILEKKLKGDYVKDTELLISMFGDTNYEEEVFCIYKVKNAEKIKVFFPDYTEEMLTKLRKFMVVEESISVTLNRN